MRKFWSPIILIEKPWFINAAEERDIFGPLLTLACVHFHRIQIPFHYQISLSGVYTQASVC